MRYFVYEGKINSTGARVSAASFLYDVMGNRKYLNQAERRAFLTAASQMSPEVRTFCRILAYTGARISEILALTPQRIDTSGRMVVIESLKKRRRGIYRAVPIPRSLINELERVHGLGAAKHGFDCAEDRLWNWCRTTAWMSVKVCMARAGISGAAASPKGLRHAFAVEALQAGVPITLVKRWLGHSRLETTEIYTEAVGEEEQAIARRFWRSF